MSDFGSIVEAVEVRAVRRVSPSFVRIELGGDCLAELGIDGPWLDQRFKVIFAGPSGTLPTLSATQDWYTEWLELAEDDRGLMRTYTVRDVVGEGVDTRLVIDIVVHEAEHDDDSGPGNDWAQAARLGDRVVIVAPRRGHVWGGIEWLPGADATDLLIVGDETALPAVYGILRDLPRDATGAAYVEVPVSDDILDDVVAPEGVELVWLPRNGAARGVELRERVLARLGRTAEAHARVAAAGERADLEIPDDPDVWETPEYSASGEDVSGQAPAEGPFAGLYAWIAGESRVVTGLRRALVKDLGVDRHQVAFMGYWREGVAMKG